MSTLYAELTTPEVICPLYEAKNNETISLEIDNKHRTIEAHLTPEFQNNFNKIDSLQKDLNDEIDRALNEEATIVNYINNQVSSISSNLELLDDNINRNRNELALLNESIIKKERLSSSLKDIELTIDKIIIDSSYAEEPERFGHYMTNRGDIKESNSYCYSCKFEVPKGKIVSMGYNKDGVNYTNPLLIRMVCAYDENDNVLPSAGFIGGNSTYYFAYPSECKYLVLSFASDVFKKGNTFPILCIYNKLQDIEPNFAINNKQLIFRLKMNRIDSLPFHPIRIGHASTDEGYAYGGSFIEIGPKTLKVAYTTGEDKISYYNEVQHGLSINADGTSGSGDDLTVIIDVKYQNANITIINRKGIYKYSTIWHGRNGKVFAEINNPFISASLKWQCSDYTKPIWIIGDSYLNGKDEARWPFYLIQNNYTNNMLIGFPGMNSDEGYFEFERSLRYGNIPKIVIWTLGMNDGDNSSINSNYLEYTEKFIALCQVNNIIPILATIPNTPLILNKYKNDYVRGSGLRFIDFAEAVGSDKYNAKLIGTLVDNTDPIEEDESSIKINKTGYKWYTNMLYKDAVHPARLGAQALYVRALLDAPELMYIN